MKVLANPVVIDVVMVHLTEVFKGQSVLVTEVKLLMEEEEEGEEEEKEEER